MVCFFKQKTSYERRISDWSSDVCSSDLGHALVLLVRMTGQHSEAGAADDGVLRRALDVVPVGQVADPELEGRLLLHAGITSRGLGEDGAFAAAEAGAALVEAAGVDDLAFLRPVPELRTEKRRVGQGGVSKG